MKINILYFLVFISLIFNVYSQEFGFIKTEGNPKLENLVGNNLVDTKIIVGKTYNTAINSYSIATSTNDIVAIKFACDTTVKLNNNTTFNLDLYEQTTTHPKYPQQTEYDSLNCQNSLISGEIEIINNAISNTSNNFYINTKLACIICGNGKFLIKADNNSSTFIIVEGAATIMDNASRKLYKVKQNDIVTITPTPLLTPRAKESMRKQNIVTTTLLDSSDYSVLNAEFAAYQQEQNKYIFITDNGNKLVKLK